MTAHPGDGAPRPGVLLHRDAFGPRPQLRAMADRLAEAGYAVLDRAALLDLLKRTL